MVAHMPIVQDVFVLGPKSIADSGREFVYLLHHQISSIALRSFAFRFFSYQSRVCLALVLPTAVPDEAGRRGLTLSIGIAMSKDSFRVLPAIMVSGFLNLFIQTVNRLFELNLPASGVDQLMISIRNPEESRSVFVKLQSALDIAMMTSKIVESTFPQSRWHRFLPQLKRKPERVPEVIICQTDCSYPDIMDILVSKLGNRLKSKTFVDHAGDERLFPSGVVQLMRIAQIPNDVRLANLVKYRGKPYVFIY